MNSGLELSPGLAALWILNAVLILLVLWTGYGVTGARRARSRHTAAEQQALVADAFRRRVDVADLVQAWERILERPPTGSSWLSSRRLVARLCEAKPDSVVSLRAVARPMVNSHNDVAAAIDDGLVRPRAFIRRYPDLHLEMLRELALLEPFIWFESLVSGRGRWGYGPLHLKAVLQDLRAASDDGSVWSEIGVQVFGKDYVVFPRLNVAERQVLRLWRFIKRPHINVRTKLRQRQYSYKLAAELRADGYPAVPLFQVHGVTDW